MELDDVLKILKEEFPDKVIDIFESLELLKESIDGTVEVIAKKVNNTILTREFESMKKYGELAEEINHIENQIEEVLDKLIIEEAVIVEEIDEEDEKRTITNYLEYEVDNNIEHTLYEDFTHKRPYGFKMNDQKMVRAKTWQDMLVKTCEYLLLIDEKKFMAFENRKAMNGKKNKYFSINTDNMRKPKKVSNKIYVEINQSGNAIRNLIIKLLKEYNFKISEYKVYYRADYSSINND